MKKTLSIILAVMLISLCIVSCDNNTSTTSLKSIQVTKPTKDTYTVGESLNTAGMVVTATYTDGKTKEVTAGYTVDTTILTTVGQTTVTVSYTAGGVTRTASFVVTVKYPPFTVTFVKNDASAKNPSSATKEVNYNKAYGTLPTIEKDNYTFLGWYDAPSGGNKVTENTTVTKASNHYLYAQWIENGKYKVVFNGNDATSGTIPAEMIGYLGEEIILPGNTGNLAKENYTFAGWVPKQGSYISGDYITSDIEVVITLLAKWEPNTYSIVYKLHGGEDPVTANPTEYTYGVGVTSFNDAERNGYTFKGWFDAETGGNEITIISTTATGEKTLHAQWELITTGKATITGGAEQGWVQLWAGGPKWAEFNVGSTISNYASPSTPYAGTTADYSTANVGGLYGWGGNTTNSRDTSGAPDYYSGTDYNNSNGNLNSANDTATQKWGAKWKMPTQGDYGNMIAYCTWTWCDGQTGDSHKQYVDGCTLKGWMVTGKGDYVGSSIFLPVSGYYNTSLSGLDVNGYYWASTPSGDTNAFGLYITNSQKTVNGDLRTNGFSVRAILAE